MGLPCKKRQLVTAAYKINYNLRNRFFCCRKILPTSTSIYHISLKIGTQEPVTANLEVTPHIVNSDPAIRYPRTVSSSAPGNRTPALSAYSQSSGSPQHIHFQIPSRQGLPAGNLPDQAPNTLLSLQPHHLHRCPRLSSTSVNREQATPDSEPILSPTRLFCIRIL